MEIDEKQIKMIINDLYKYAIINEDTRMAFRLGKLFMALGLEEEANEND